MKGFPVFPEFQTWVRLHFVFLFSDEKGQGNSAEVKFVEEGVHHDLQWKQALQVFRVFFLAPGCLTSLRNFSR